MNRAEDMIYKEENILFPNCASYFTKEEWMGIYHCQTAHCGRHKPHFDFGELAFPIVPYRHLPQTLRGLTAECRSLV